MKSRSFTFNPSIAGLLMVMLATLVLTARADITTPQMTAISVIAFVIGGVIFFIESRVAFASFGVGLLMLTGLMTVEDFIEHAAFDVFAFLFGMMSVIGYLSVNHFFRWMIDHIIDFEPASRSGARLTTVLLISSAVLAALVDEATSILVMLAVQHELLKESKINPIPFILMLVFATNIGSSATAIGNPVGVLIALKAGLSADDFLVNATPISLVILIICIATCHVLFRKEIHALDMYLRTNRGQRIDEMTMHEDEIIVRRRAIKKCVLLFSGTIVGLMTHKVIEHTFGLEENTMLIGTALIAGGIALALAGQQAKNIVEHHVEWWALSFFFLIFASVGALITTNVHTLAGNVIVELTGGDASRMTIAFAWSSGVFSALLDNVLAVATFIPVIQNILDQGMASDTLWWATLFGATLGGNATVIGSTANIVALSEIEKAGGISFFGWMKYGIPITLVTLTPATILLLL